MPLHNNPEGQADQAGIKPGEAIAERHNAKQRAQESRRQEKDRYILVASPEGDSDAESEQGTTETGPSASEDANDLENGGAAGMPPNDTARQGDEDLDVESYASTTSDRESEVGSEGEANVVAGEGSTNEKDPRLYRADW